MAINASAELSVLQAVAQFLTYAVMAVFAENAVRSSARWAFPVSEQAGQRPQNQHMAVLYSHHSGTDHQRPHGLGCPSLTLPALAKVLPGWLPVNALRPLVFLNCSLIAMGIVWLLLGLFPKSRDACREQLPGALQLLRAGHPAGCSQPEL